MTVTALHPGRMAAAARGDLAERLVDVAGDLAILVRDEGPEAIAAFLARYTGAEKDALLVVLAAMLPIDDMTKEQMLAWCTFDEHGDPLDDTHPVLARRRDRDTSGQEATEPRLPARECALQTFAELTAQGLGPEEAAVRMGKDRRTGFRYARTLREREEVALAGPVTPEQADRNRADLERALREGLGEAGHAA